MSKPILVEECTHTELVPSLERVLNDLDRNSTHHDYIVALIIVLLAEAGFYLSSSHSGRPQGLKLLHIPKNWKSRETGVYEMYFQLETVPDIECKLVVVPLGDTLILNFFPLMDGKTTYSISVQTLKYVNPYSSDLYGRYMNLKAISHRFKDQLSTPVRRDLFIKAGVMGPAIETIPFELKFRILKLLDVYSLTRMAQCCRGFHEVCSESQLWCNLLRRDFPGRSWPAETAKDSYRLRSPRTSNRLIATNKNTSNWVETLPLVLLGIRTAVKEDLNITTAEMVYGTSIRLPTEDFPLRSTNVSCLSSLLASQRPFPFVSSLNKVKRKNVTSAANEDDS